MAIVEMDINNGVTEFRATPGAVLLDVRSAEEYAAGHIAGSVNLPLNMLGNIDRVAADLDTPLFLHCKSGARSRKAADFLDKQGYLQLWNIGGIQAWKGEVERG